LLPNPAKLCIPVKIQKEIQLFRKECLAEKSARNDIVVEADVRSRFYVGNRPAEQKCTKANSRYNVLCQNADKSSLYSLVIRPSFDDQCNLIIQATIRSIPKILLPVESDTRKTLLKKISSCNYIDLEFRSRDRNILHLAPDSTCPRRRNMGMCTKLPFTLEKNVQPTVNGGDDTCTKEGIGKSVAEIYSYSSHVMPLDCWRCRPLKNLDYAFMLTIWEYCWPYLTDISRKRPPNGMQVLFYYGLFNSKMGKHRDNYDKRNLNQLLQGKDLIPKNDHWKGAKNSQVHGSNVLVYTTGNRPMIFQFSFPKSMKNLSDSRDKYVTDAKFQFELSNGWISILDPIDDIRGVHEIYGKDNRKDTYRVAWVMRWLGVTQHYFVETSGLVRTDKMLKHVDEMSIKVDDRYPLFITPMFKSKK
jgi:hypothetical protein